MVRLLGKLLHNMIVLFDTGGMLNRISVCIRKGCHEFLFFLLTASPHGPISDPRDRTGNQLRQTRGPNVHETVLYMGLPQPKPFCIAPSNACCACLLHL